MLLVANFNFLLKKYSIPVVGVNPPIPFKNNWLDVDVTVIVCIVALSTSTIFVPFLNIWTESPSFKLDLSKSDLRVNVDPLIVSISKEHEVLYIHELNHTSFFVLSIVGFGTTSPTFFTAILSPSEVTLDPSVGNNSKSDNTPVILNSTFLVKSPSSYPKTFSSDLKSSVVDMVVDTPVQFKNWLTVLSV